VRKHGQSVHARPGHVREGPLEIGGPLRLHHVKPDSQPSGRDFCLLHHALLRALADTTWHPEDTDSIHPRERLLEQVQTLADKFWSNAGEPREIPPPAGQDW
jgi:hypothetical protein